MPDHLTSDQLTMARHMICASACADGIYNDGSDDINPALVGLTHDTLAFRATTPPSIANYDILQWVKDGLSDADGDVLDMPVPTHSAFGLTTLPK